MPLEQLTSYGPVKRESVYFMRPGYGVRIPTPPPFHNKGNYVFSLAQLGRQLAERAEELGAMVLPETDAHTPARLRTAPSAACVTGDKGLGRDGEPTGTLRARRRDPRPGHRARGGHAGPPDRRAHRGASACAAQNPQVWTRSASRRCGGSRGRSTG